MEEIILKIQFYLPIVLQFLGGLVVAATAVARVTPSPKDDEIVSSISYYFFKAMGKMPTLGVNPRTKKLEEALKEMKEK